MKTSKILSVAAFIIHLASTGSATNYDDLTAQGYRWVTVDGPYACVVKDDLRLITKNPYTEAAMELIKRPGVYFLLKGYIVKMLGEDQASGFSLIRAPGIPKDLWTLSKFLSRRPVEDTFGVIETPETSGLILDDSMVVPTPARAH
jgi:hypothetical protein